MNKILILLLSLLCLSYAAHFRNQCKRDRIYLPSHRIVDNPACAIKVVDGKIEKVDSKN